MKVVINRCYGGFSLSKAGVARWAELQGRQCFFFTGGRGKPYTRDTDSESDSLFWTAFDTDQIPKGKLPEDWYTQHYLSTRFEDRSDPHLLQVVRELGAKADGACAKLEIIEIPDEMEYHIEEYDGIEHVAENHRTWP